MEVIVYGALCPAGEEKALARRLLVEALRREYGLEALPPIAREAGGKPFFPDRPELQFNLSHTRGAVVCAIHHLPVGVDVERLRAAPPRLAGGLDDRAFFRLWTGREATVKRRGQGLAALLASFPPDGRCVWREDFLPGYITAVCPSADIGARWVALDWR